MSYSDVVITPRPRSEDPSWTEYVAAIVGNGIQDAVYPGTYDELLDVERDAFNRNRAFRPGAIEGIIAQLRRGEVARFNIGDVLDLPA